jgi:hypothetical protein
MAGNSPLSSKQPNRTPQSGLRREVTSAGSGDVPTVHEGIPPRHASYNAGTYDYYRTQEPRHASPMAQQHTAACALPAEQSPQIRDTKKMEDDLRRILKLDSIPSGVQSSYA